MTKLHLILSYSEHCNTTRLLAVPAQYTEPGVCNGTVSVRLSVSV